MSLPREDYRKVMSDEDIAAMNERTEQRRRAAIAALGSRWLGYLPPKQQAQNVKPLKKARTA